MVRTAGTVENLAPGYDSAKANVLKTYGNTQEVAKNVNQNIGNTASNLAGQNMAASDATVAAGASDVQAMNDRFSRLMGGVAAEMGIMAQSQELSLARTEAALSSYLTSLKAALPAVEARMDASLQAALARMGGIGGGTGEGSDPLTDFNEESGYSFKPEDINPSNPVGAAGGDLGTLNNAVADAEGTLNPFGEEGNLSFGQHTVESPEGPIETDPIFKNIQDFATTELNRLFTEGIEILGGVPNIEAAVSQIKNMIIQQARQVGEPLTMAQIEKLNQWGILQITTHQQTTNSATDETIAEAKKDYGKSEVAELLHNKEGSWDAFALTGTDVSRGTRSGIMELADIRREGVEAIEAQERLAEDPARYEVAGQYEDDPGLGKSAASKEREAEMARLDKRIKEMESVRGNTTASHKADLAVLRERFNMLRDNILDHESMMDVYWGKYGKGELIGEVDVANAEAKKLMLEWADNFKNKFTLKPPATSTKPEEPEKYEHKSEDPIAQVWENTYKNWRPSGTSGRSVGGRDKLKLGPAGTPVQPSPKKKDPFPSGYLPWGSPVTTPPAGGGY